MSVAGKVVIVTGAARGIGLEYCKALVAGGANVMAADVASCDLALALQGQGKLIDAKLDVTSFESAQAGVAKTLEAFGRVDGLINNAALYGTLKSGRFTDIEEVEWDAAMAVNVKGIWNCCRAVVPFMRERKSGSIVNIASLAPLYGTPFVLHYTTSKGAVIGLTTGLAREIGKDNVRVNAIAPTLVMTEGTSQFYGVKTDRTAEAVKGSQAIPRSLNAGDVTGTALWLLSDASEFVTGQTIRVDGGTIMH
jgi:NAD(P)-dependent dehydrogenase (short-subunit alcohol dehydrogenase family)